MDRLLTFVELAPFNESRSEHFTDSSFRELQHELTMDPEAGDIMVGTGGCRKLRFASKKRNKGKSGGIRIIYFFRSKSDRIYLIDVIDKVNQANITDEQARQLKRLTSLLGEEL